jgi:hypothetical protein
MEPEGSSTSVHNEVAQTDNDKGQTFYSLYFYYT